MIIAAVGSGVDDLGITGEVGCMFEEEFVPGAEVLIILDDALVLDEPTVVLMAEERAAPVGMRTAVMRIRRERMSEGEKGIARHRSWTSFIYFLDFIVQSKRRSLSSRLQS